MGFLDWLFGDNEDDNNEKPEDQKIKDDIEEVVKTLEDSIKSGEGTSWFDRLFGDNNDEE
jgi:hypothetical protein